MWEREGVDAIVRVRVRVRHGLRLGARVRFSPALALAQALQEESTLLCTAAREFPAGAWA